MDSYVSKPFRPQELFDAIEELSRRKGLDYRRKSDVPPIPAAGDVSAGLPVQQSMEPACFDPDEAIVQAGGSKVVLEELVDLFIEECPKQMNEIREAQSQQEWLKLQRAAHTLKGSVSIFAAQRAYDAALRIEKMGKEQNASDFDTAWARLEDEVEKLKSALVEYCGEIGERRVDSWTD
jgi:HPt (histidine-containing phosphotransfer) domain-containing protein